MDFIGNDVFARPFSFSTDSPWLGYNVATLRIHSRARIMQAEYRAHRSQRHNAALEHLLEIAHEHMRGEHAVSQRPLRRPRIVDLRPSRGMVDLRNQIIRPEPESKPRSRHSSNAFVPSTR